MSKSTHQFEIKGVDKSAGAFASIKQHAAVTGAQIRNMVGGALAGVGAYLGLRTLSANIDELGKLSDIAQKTGTSVDELTKAATAFSVVGVQGMGVDQIGKAFDNMAKSTGRQGMAGFYQTIEELGKIPDIAERGKAAVQVFGESGMEFMPLINGAKEGTGAIRSVIETFPGVSQAAADAGDALADAKTIGASGFKSIWLNAIGAVCRQFGLDFRGGAAAMVAYLDYGAHVAWRYLKSLFDANEQGVRRFEMAWKAVGNGIVRSVVTISATCYEYIKTIPERIVAGFANAIMTIPGIFSDSFAEKRRQTMEDWFAEISQGMWQSIDDDLKTLGIDVVRDSLGKELQAVFSDVNTDDLDKKLKDMLELSKKIGINIDDSVGAGNEGNDKKNEGNDKGNKSNINGRLFDVEHRKPEIRNDLILGGSNAATRLQLLGPSLQSETKKQTQVLESMNDKLSKLVSQTDEPMVSFDTLD